MESIDKKKALNLLGMATRARKFTTEEVSQAIGKQRSIIAIADQGFTKSLMKMKGFNDMNE